jgi:proline-rich protein PRCC
LSTALTTAAAALRAQAKPFEGDRMAKRKHQIGTLFYNAKMRELEIMEGKAAGMRARGEAKGKYGW